MESSKGGLDVRPIREMNEALKTKSKWLWRFAKKDNAAWKYVIKAKYGIDDLGWWSKKSSYVHGFGCQKLISAVVEPFKFFVIFR